MVTVLLHALALLVMPFLLTGVIHRTRSLWSGRRGPPLMQSAHDVLRLLRKAAVYGDPTTTLFRIAPWVFLVTALFSALIAPILGPPALVSFPFDFVWFAYVWGLGRVAIMLAALDTGSSFEGMGSAREATFSTLVEPALFLVLGAFCLTSGANTLRGALALSPSLGEASLAVWFLGVLALIIVLQVETSRMPVDDPTTHLELTMIHEVMVLDHSGPDLAAIQYGSAVKLQVGISILATLLDPWSSAGGWLSRATHLGWCLGLAVAIGTVESLVARLRLATVPKYIAVAVGAAAVALLATTWQAGNAP